MVGGGKRRPRDNSRIDANLLALVGFILVVFSVFLQALPVRAQEAKILISPSVGSFSVDSTFDVSIFVDTGGSEVNAVDVRVKFPPDKLQVINPSTGTSFISLWLQQPTFSNKVGLAALTYELTTGHIKARGGLLGRIFAHKKDSKRFVKKLHHMIDDTKDELKFLDSRSHRRKLVTEEKYLKVRLEQYQKLLEKFHDQFEDINKEE